MMTINRPASRTWLVGLRSTLTDERLAILLIAAFALFNLVALDRVPLIHADEPWIAEPGLRFWQRGVFASELYRGFFGAEQHYLLHAPLFSILTGGVVSLFGAGPVQVRLVSLTMAAATAVLTFFLGRRLLSSRHGLLAVLMLTTWHITPGGPNQTTGIVLVDLGRLARYDIAVPVAGVAAFLLVLPIDAGVTSSRWRLVVAGAIAGLGVMCHPAGLAWVAILCVTVIAARGWSAGLAASVWIAGGAAVALLPWLALMIDGWQDLPKQHRYISSRYDVLSPRFYVENVWREWRRYGQIGRGLQHMLPGAWLIAICGSIGVWILFRRADTAGSMARGAEPPERHDARLTLLRTALVVGVVLFALGLGLKVYQYAAALWPLLALTAAVGLMNLLRASVPAIRVAAIVMMIAAVADGAIAWVGVMRRTSTPYGELCERLAAEIPRDSRVLALPPYWFCLAPQVAAYRSLLVPFMMSRTQSSLDPEALDEAFSAAEADILVLDRPMLALMKKDDDVAAEALRHYVARHSARHVIVEDASYGRFEIHYLRPRRAAVEAVETRP